MLRCQPPRQNHSSVPISPKLDPALIWTSVQRRGYEFSVGFLSTGFLQSPLKSREKLPLPQASSDWDTKHKAWLGIVSLAKGDSLGFHPFLTSVKSFYIILIKPRWNNICFPINHSSKTEWEFPPPPRRVSSPGSSQLLPISSSRSCSYEMQTIHLKGISLCGQRNITEVRKQKRIYSVWSPLLTKGWVAVMKACRRFWIHLRVEISL